MSAAGERAEGTREAGPSPPAYKWLVVGMLWFVCFFNYADRQAIFSVFKPIKEEMGLSDSQLGVVASSFMWVYAGAAPIAGLVGDRFRRKTLILGGLAFWSLICALTALSTKYSHLVLFRALEGFGEAFYFPASMSLISSYHGPLTRSRAMGFHQSSVYLGTIAGGTLAGFLADQSRWRYSFYLLGALGLLLSLLLTLFLREPSREGPDPRSPANGKGSGPQELRRELFQAIPELFGNPRVVLVMTVFVGANFVAAGYLSWLPAFLNRKFPLSLAEAGFGATAPLQAGSIVGVFVGGFLADRWSRRCRTGRLRTQAVGLLGGVSFIFLIGWTGSFGVLVTSLVAFGLLKGLYDSNIWAALHDFVRTERRAAAVGFMNAVGWLGGALAPLAIGAGSERYGLSACLSAGFVPYLFSGLLLVGGIRMIQRKST